MSSGKIHDVMVAEFFSLPIQCMARRKLWGASVPVYLCCWHVKRAWLGNLINKVPDPVKRKAMFIDLVDMMQFGLAHAAEGVAEQMFQDKLAAFRLLYVGEELFQQYLTTYWIGNGKMGKSCS